MVIKQAAPQVSSDRIRMFIEIKVKKKNILSKQQQPQKN